MNNKIIYLGLLMFCGSCTKEEPEIPPGTPEDMEDCGTISSVDISFTPATAVTVSARANTENDIYDVNFYLYDLRTKTMKNYYLAGGKTLNVELVNGDYDVYAVANRGADMGAADRAALEAMKYTVNSEAQVSGRMVMSGRQRITVNGNTSVRIPLVRVAAKVTFNISMSAAMAGATIVHIQPFCCCKSVGLFAESKVNGDYERLESYPLYDVSASAPSTLTKSFYFLENKQGKRSNITSQTGRIMANAPTYATYIWLRVLKERKFIDYRIYLGENTTDDFNLCRNTDYNYNIVIGGENLADLRVSTTNIIVCKDTPVLGQEIKNYDQFYFPGSDAGYCQLRVETANNEPDNEYYFSFRRVSGTFGSNWYMQYMNKDEAMPTYYKLAENEKLKVLTGNGRGVFNLRFVNGATTVYDHVFIFTVTNKYGYAKNIRITSSNVWN